MTDDLSHTDTLPEDQPAVDDATEAGRSGAPREGVARRPVELGWVAVGKLSRSHRETLLAAQQAAEKLLGSLFPEFDWRLPFVEHRPGTTLDIQEPVDLLRIGCEFRDRHRWDFTFVLTSADLHTYYRPSAFGATAQTLNVAVVSLGRLWPEYARINDAGAGEWQANTWTRRLSALTVHLLGDLAGLGHAAEEDDYMHPPDAAADLERVTRLQEADDLREQLVEVADERLEENPHKRRLQGVRFYLRAAWIGRGEIARSVLQAAPWKFPFRLSRLTAAAFSTLAILLMTAEVWELGMRQPAWLVTGLAFTVWAGATGFVLRRQNLFLTRRGARLTEQTVFTNVAISLIVASGLLFTFALLLGTALLVSTIFFDDALVEHWTASLPEAYNWMHRLRLTMFDASLGLVIGSLGASFEGRQYFQHIAYVDEEV